MLEGIRKLKNLAEIEFADIVEDVFITDVRQLRIILKDSSFVDVWYSLKLKGRYSYHWERKHIDGLITVTITHPTRSGVIQKRFQNIFMMVRIPNLGLHLDL
ncbi:MAG: hypothetical protein MRJ65_04075 [Candidatus Brocadiaceae bacterium]|nr:hypothetical protein [Candidatus Brocadiaceae bacterium]